MASIRRVKEVCFFILEHLTLHTHTHTHAVIPYGSVKKCGCKHIRHKQVPDAFFVHIQHSFIKKILSIEFNGVEILN